MTVSLSLDASNRVKAEDSSVHNWYRFVLSFPPHLVRHYVHRFGLRAGQVVLDPFCGTGTTLVECKKLGINSVGIERNPIAAFASQVKTDWSPDPDSLVAHAARIAEVATRQLEDDGIAEFSGLPLFGDAPAARAPLRTLPMDAARLLLTGSISPLPLHKTLVLLEAIRACADQSYVRHELLALAKATVFGVGNVEFGPEVGVGPPKEDAPVVNLWRDNVWSIAQDIRLTTQGRDVPSLILQADSRSTPSTLKPGSIDAVITSPPYPNEKDYTRTTRLESVLLGFIRTKDDLRELKRELVRSNTRGVYKSDSDDAFVAGHPEIERIADAIERRRIELGKTSGFERMYPRVTKLYFGGITRHLSQLRHILRPGAQLAYVVGDQASYLRVMIRTGQLFAGLATSLGYQVIGTDLFRTRLATATREQLREEVLLLRWPG